MPRRLSPWAVALFLVASLTVGWMAPAAAQVQIPAEEAADAALVQRLLDEGVALEQQRRWGEALLHYEDALRTHPGQQALSQRLAAARIHFDLARRYADASFRDAIARTSQARALELYGELLATIEANYVDPPNWPRILEQGAAHVDIALREKEFRQRNLAGVSDRRIAHFRRYQMTALKPAAVRSRTEALEAVQRTAEYASQVLGVDNVPILMEYVCGATTGLDPYSGFLTRGQLDDVYAQIEGNFVGLGVEIRGDAGALLVVNRIEGSPAARAGLKKGERIVAIDDTRVDSLSPDAAADLLKGEEGTSVRLVVRDAEDRDRAVLVRRERIDVPSVEQVRIEDAASGIGYLKISSFQKTTLRDLDKALWDLHRQGMRSLIIDLRGNPGGLLTSSVEIADRFVTDGTIVATRGRIAREDFDYRAHVAGTWRVPLVVLIDRDSASASEILAGAIHDLKRGTIVGERSYGKGSVQGIFPLTTAKAGVRLTTAKFYSPAGVAISHRGVSPDVTIRQAAKVIAAEPPRPIAADDSKRDAILAAGVQAARRLLAQR